MTPFRTVLTAASTALALAAAAPPASALQPDDRFTLVNRCVDLRSETLGRAVATDVGPFRMQATALGRYLLYGKSGQVLAVDPSSGAVAGAATPGPQADFRVDVRGDAFTLSIAAPGGRFLAVDDAGRLEASAAPGAFTFPKAEGCATFPESDTDVVGEPTRGAGPFAETSGLLESHSHWMAFEIFGGNAHCGRPWSPYGVAAAMVDCPDHEPGGFGLAFENAVSGKPATDTHDTVGWPTFRDWPAPGSLTHEGTYYRWVERAYRGGLRVLVNLAVESTGLCGLQPSKRHSCNEMDAVRLEIEQLEALQDYIDAQSGGPGKGWMRIVKTPFEAREVVNAGKLAVISGVEISRLFDCRIFNGVPACTRESVRRDLDALHAMGVRSMELAVKTDTAISGAAGDPGTNGLVTNASNKIETGRFFDMRTCTGDPQASDKPQLTFGPGAEQASAFASLIAPGGQTPVYPPTPHCNTVGLSAIGRDLVGRMMDKGMLIDPDHMSQAARQSTLDLIEARGYSGVISSHSWSTPVDEPRILRAGGLVIPKTAAIGMSSDSSWMVAEHKRIRALRDPRYLFGFGFGSDMNGVARQPIPRADATTNDPLTYPFKSLDGKQTIEQATTGKRTWDFNKDGVAQFGLYLDWLEEVRRRGDPSFAQDMLRGSEAYLQMWERAVGVPAKRALAARARLGAAGLGKVLLDATPEAMLRRAGQPLLRGGRTWRYDVSARDGRPAGRVAMVLSAAGRSALVLSTGPEHTAGGVGAGDRVTSKLLRASRASGRRGVRVG
ncbi:MAG: hypothetical protein H0V81_02230, partial [Solirubrobacterales bacterium]|nr:hypothetical protein [Solirubrobacterales bacterium]